MLQHFIVHRGHAHANVNCCNFLKFICEKFCGQQFLISAIRVTGHTETMPKRRQQKVLASVPEDEELVEEVPTMKSKRLDDSLLQRIDSIEQQGEQIQKR